MTGNTLTIGLSSDSQVQIGSQIEVENDAIRGFDQDVELGLPEKWIVSKPDKFPRAIAVLNGPDEGLWSNDTSFKTYFCAFVQFLLVRRATLSAKNSRGFLFRTPIQIFDK